MNPTVQYVINAVLGLIIAAGVAQLKSAVREFRFLRKGVTALLHNIFCKTCEVYLTRGYITMAELQDLDDLYECYKALGQNGLGEELYRRCKKMEIR